MNQHQLPRQIEVQIMDQSYTLSCPQTGETGLRTAVAKVDATMCAIRDAGKLKSRDRIAVLACINIAHDSSNPQSTAEEMERQQRLSRLIERLDQALTADDCLS